MWILLLTLLSPLGSVWLDTSRMSAEDTKTLESTLARMVRGKSVSPAARREESRFLVRVQLGGAGRASGSFVTGAGGLPAGLGSELETGESSQPRSVARIDLSLVDVLEGETLFERGMNFRLPLTLGRLTDPTLRANLSHVVDVMEKTSRTTVTNEAPPSFGPDARA